MARLQTLIDKRATAWTRYQELLARAGDDGFDTETREAIDAAEAEIRQLGEDIERLKRADGLIPDADEVDRSGVPGGDTRGDDGTGGGATDEARYEEGFGQFLRGGLDNVDDELRSMVQDNFRAQGTTPDAAGGALVPETFRKRLVETMLQFGGILQVANNITTATGAKLLWPTNDDTGNKGALLAENTQATEQDVTFGADELDAFTYTSKIVRVSLQLVQDSVFDLDVWLPRKLGERIARIVNEHLTIGDGVGKPTGVVTAAPIGKTGAAGQTTSVTHGDLVDLEHSVDPAYRNERSRFMWHDLTLAALRKVLDADGRPLWQPALTAGSEDSYNGRRYTVNNDMPQMGAGNKSILFGDFNAYIARQVRGGRVLRLTERYADFLQVGFIGFERWDGVLEDAGAVKAYANAAA